MGPFHTSFFRRKADTTEAGNLLLVQSLNTGIAAKPIQLLSPIADGLI